MRARSGLIKEVEGVLRGSFCVSPSIVGRRREGAAIKRFLPITLVVGGLVLVFALPGGDATATPTSGATTTAVGRATMPAVHLNASDYTLRLTLRLKHDADAVTVVVNFDPGGTTGWHLHPGPVINLVIAGTVTYYRGDDPACTPHRYAAGQGFWDHGGDVHIVRNEGTTPATVVTTFLNVPPGTAPRIDEPNPGNCPF